MENKEDKNPNMQTDVTINRNTKVLHCSDGVIEEIDDEIVEDLNAAQKPEENVDPKTLTWGPWFSHYAWKSGTKVLSAVDYTGESLSNFFGITTPKYQIEIDEYERLSAEKKAMDEESAGWVKNNSGGDVPLVLNEPTRGVKHIETA